MILEARSPRWGFWQGGFLLQVGGASALRVQPPAAGVLLGAQVLSSLCLHATVFPSARPEASFLRLNPPYLVCVSEQLLKSLVSISPELGGPVCSQMLHPLARGGRRGGWKALCSDRRNGLVPGLRSLGTASPCGPARMSHSGTHLSIIGASGSWTSPFLNPSCWRQSSVKRRGFPGCSGPTGKFSLPEFGVHLAELTVDPQGALAIRQVRPGRLVRFVSNFPLLVTGTSLWERIRPIYKRPRIWNQTRMHFRGTCGVGRVCGFGVQSIFPHRAFCLSPSQLASVILKQYVETHWCAQSERFRPPETTERVRTAHDPRLWVRGAGSG